MSNLIKCYINSLWEAHAAGKHWAAVLQPLGECVAEDGGEAIGQEGVVAADGAVPAAAGLHEQGGEGCEGGSAQVLHVGMDGEGVVEGGAREGCGVEGSWHVDEV